MGKAVIVTLTVFLVFTLLIASLFISCTVLCHRRYSNKSRIRDEQRLSPNDNNNFPVDIVVTWVDSSDEIWQNQRNEASVRAFGTMNISTIRYPPKKRSEHELRVCVLSVFRFAPWIRKLFIVTQRPQRPSFLNSDLLSNSQKEKIVIVHHDEIFPDSSDLPTFNSQSIECHLHRIPNLSEHFISTNDDLFFLRHAVAGDYFTKDGEPIVSGDWIFNYNVFYDRKSKLYINNNEGDTDSTFHALSLVKGCLVYNRLHTLMATTKSIMMACDKIFKKELTATSSSQFRHIKPDEQVPPYTLALNYGIAAHLMVSSTNLRLLQDSNGHANNRFLTYCSYKYEPEVLSFIENTVLSQPPRREYMVGIDEKKPVLLVLAQCSDELVFGASFLLLLKNPMIITVLVDTPAKRILELENVIAKLKMDGGDITLIKTPQQLLVPNSTNAFHKGEKLPNFLSKLASKHSIGAIISYDSAQSEASHRKRIQYQGCNRVACDAAQLSAVPFFTFEMKNSQENIFNNQKNRLLRNYY
jgi:hypothetical protein